MRIPNIKPLDSIFTDREAWALFKWTAWGETIGWTMLLIGILFRALGWPGESWLLPIGGSLHGMFVIAYMGAVFAVHRSFRRKWSTSKMIVAELINAIPYAVLVLEQLEAHHRTAKTSAEPKELALE